MHIQLDHVRFVKLFFHGIILVAVLTLLFHLIADIISLAVNTKIEINDWYITIMMAVWLFFALQNDHYNS